MQFDQDCGAVEPAPLIEGGGVRIDSEGSAVTAGVCEKVVDESAAPLVRQNPLEVADPGLLGAFRLLGGFGFIRKGEVSRVVYHAGNCRDALRCGAHPSEVPAPHPQDADVHVDAGWVGLEQTESAIPAGLLGFRCKAAGFCLGDSQDESGRSSCNANHLNSS